MVDKKKVKFRQTGDAILPVSRKEEIKKLFIIITGKTPIPSTLKYFLTKYQNGPTFPNMTELIDEILLLSDTSPSMTSREQAALYLTHVNIKTPAERVEALDVVELSLNSGVSKEDIIILIYEQVDQETVEKLDQINYTNLARDNNIDELALLSKDDLTKVYNTLTEEADAALRKKYGYSEADFKKQTEEKQVELMKNIKQADSEGMPVGQSATVWVEDLTDAQKEQIKDGTHKVEYIVDSENNLTVKVVPKNTDQDIKEELTDSISADDKAVNSLLLPTADVDDDATIKIGGGDGATIKIGGGLEKAATLADADNADLGVSLSNPVAGGVLSFTAAVDDGAYNADAIGSFEFNQDNYNTDSGVSATITLTNAEGKTKTLKITRYTQPSVMAEFLGNDTTVGVEISLYTGNGTILSGNGIKALTTLGATLEDENFVKGIADYEASGGDVEAFATSLQGKQDAVYAFASTKDWGVFTTDNVIVDGGGLDSLIDNAANRWTSNLEQDSDITFDVSALQGKIVSGVSLSLEEQAQVSLIQTGKVSVGSDGQARLGQSGLPGEPGGEPIVATQILLPPTPGMAQGDFNFNQSVFTSLTLGEKAKANKWEYNLTNGINEYNISYEALALFDDQLAIEQGAAITGEALPEQLQPGGVLAPQGDIAQQGGVFLNRDEFLNQFGIDFLPPEGFDEKGNPLGINGEKISGLDLTDPETGKLLEELPAPVNPNAGNPADMLAGFVPGVAEGPDLTDPETGKLLEELPAPVNPDTGKPVKMASSEPPPSNDLNGDLVGFGSIKPSNIDYTSPPDMTGAPPDAGNPADMWKGFEGESAQGPGGGFTAGPYPY